MKITPEHFAALKALVGPADTPERRALYLAGKYHNADRTKDLDMRYRWDLYHATVKYDAWTKAVYEYANDNHIDTALRAIVPPLKAQEKAGAQ